MDHVWKLCVPDMNVKPCDLKAVGAPEKSMNLQLGQSVRADPEMKTLRRTLWNFRSIILILVTPLLLLPLPLVISTKVSGNNVE